MNKIVIIAMAIILVALTGCIGGPGESLNTTALKAMMAQSVENMDTYRFDLETRQNMEFINLSENQTNPGSVEVISKGQGAVNLTGRFMTMSMTTTATPENDRQNSSTTLLEMYFQNNTIYMKADNNWTKMVIDQPDELWSRQNMVRNQVAMLNASELTLMGSEKIDGEDCYKVKVVPDMGTYASILSEQMGSSMPLMFMNLSELYNRSEMTWNAWITSDTRLLKKSDMQMSFSMTPEIMGLPKEIVGDFKMNVDLVAVMTYHDYGENIEISIPSEAMQAKLMEIPTLSPPQA